MLTHYMHHISKQQSGIIILRGLQYYIGCYALLFFWWLQQLHHQPQRSLIIIIVLYTHLYFLSWYYALLLRKLSSHALQTYHYSSSSFLITTGSRCACVVAVYACHSEKEQVELSLLQLPRESIQALRCAKRFPSSFLAWMNFKRNKF